MAEEGEDGEFADCSYWDNRYSKSTASEPSYDWLRSYQSLVPFFEKHLFVPKPPATRPHILHLGSGNSTVPIDLHRAGYTIQACIDFSTVVVDTMKQMHEEGGDIKWVTGDVRDMKQQVPDASVDVAFDKSTLDSMVWGSAWDPPETVIQDTTHYINEVRTGVPQIYNFHFDGYVLSKCHVLYCLIER